MNDLMEWWRWFYAYIRVLLAIVSFGTLLLMFLAVLMVVLWVIKKLGEGRWWR